MKRKGLPDAPSGRVLLIGHAALFTLFTIGLWMSVIATFNYPGNAAVPFDVFRPMLVERMNWTIAWAVLLLAHLTIYSARAWWRHSIRQARLDAVAEFNAVRLHQAEATLGDNHAEDDYIDWPAAQRKQKS